MISIRVLPRDMEDKTQPPSFLENGGKTSQEQIFYFLNFIYLFLTVLGLHCCESFFLVGASRGYSLVVVPKLLILVAFLVAEHNLEFGLW